MNYHFNFYQQKFRYLDEDPRLNRIKECKQIFKKPYCRPTVHCISVHWGHAHSKAGVWPVGLIPCPNGVAFNGRGPSLGRYSCYFWACDMCTKDSAHKELAERPPFQSYSPNRLDFICPPFEHFQPIIPLTLIFNYVLTF